VIILLKHGDKNMIKITQKKSDEEYVFDMLIKAKEPCFFCGSSKPFDRTTKYTVFVGTPIKYEYKNDDTIFWFKCNVAPNQEYSISSNMFNKGRLQCFLSDYAFIYDIPLKAFYYLHDKLRPYRTPYWDKRLYDSIIRSDFMCSDIEIEYKHTVCEFYDRIPDYMKWL
jgi:hypothetical protein